MLANIDIDKDYILTSHLGEWQKLYMEYKFSDNQSNWDLKSELPKVHKEIHESITRFTLSNGESRLLAWSLLLGLCSHNVKTSYRSLYNGYLADAFDLKKSTITDVSVQK